MGKGGGNGRGRGVQLPWGAKVRINRARAAARERGLEFQPRDPGAPPPRPLQQTRIVVRRGNLTYAARRGDGSLATPPSQQEPQPGPSRRRAASPPPDFVDLVTDSSDSDEPPAPKRMDGRRRDMPAAVPEDEHMEDDEQPGPDGDERSGKMAGSAGAAEQIIMPWKQRGVGDVSRVFRNRMKFVFRNHPQGQWRIINTDGTNVKTIWSDFQCLNDHVLGFYLTPYEFARLVEMNFPFNKIDFAKWKITGVRVVQNSLIGGTDIHYANYNGADPMVYICPEGRRWPLYRQALQDVNPNVTDPAGPSACEVIGQQLNRARQGIAIPPRVEFGKLYGPERAAVNQANESGAYDFRDLEGAVAKQFIGFSKSLKTWNVPVKLFNGPKGQVENDIWNTVEAEYEDVPFKYDGETGLPFYGTTSVGIQSGQNNRFNTNGNVPKLGTRTLNGLPNSFINNPVKASEIYPAMMFPVGPTTGCPIGTYNAVDNSVSYQGGNMPTMFKLEAIPDPTGKEQDYSVIFTIETEFGITMSDSPIDVTSADFDRNQNYAITYLQNLLDGDYVHPMGCHGLVGRAYYPIDGGPAGNIQATSIDTLSLFTQGYRGTPNQDPAYDQIERHNPWDNVRLNGEWSEATLLANTRNRMINRDINFDDKDVRKIAKEVAEECIAKRTRSKMNVDKDNK